MDSVTIVGIGVGILGVVATIATPEIRRILRLDGSLFTPHKILQQTNIEQANMSNLPKPTNQKPTYDSKTERIKTWAELIKTVAPFIWGVVILLVIIPLIGQVVIANAFSANPPTVNANKPAVVVLPKQTDWSKVNQAMKQALEDANESAENYASKELATWIDELMNRVDKSFLDWYFGYFNQKQIEYKSLFVQLSSGVTHLLNPDKATPDQKIAEVLTQDFQKEFAKRVLIPQTAQLRLERITQQTVNYYLDELRDNVNVLPVKYQIPKADWDRYLSEVAIAINDTEGKISNLSLKVLLGGGSYLAVKPLVAPLVLKVGSKIAVKFAGKAGAKIASKTGTLLAGKASAAVLDCTVGVGIILWDVWDNYHTANIEKPILRENLAGYLKEVKDSLLNNPENGIMTVVDHIQNKIVESI